MAKPTIDTSAYRGRATIHFHPGKHYYTVSVPEMNCEKVYQPGVTTILKIKDKSGPLIWWKGEVDKGHIISRVEGLRRDTAANGGKLEVVSVEFVNEVAAEIPGCHNKVRDEAAEVGTLAHDYLFNFLMWREFGDRLRPLRPMFNIPGRRECDGYTKLQIDQANSAIDAGLKFYTEHEVKPITLETPVWSPTLGFIGTDDFIGSVDGEDVVLDYKTGKRLYSEVWLQLAAYQCAYQEENPKKKIKARVAINIGKEDGRLDFQRRPNKEFYEADLEGFKSCLGAYRWDRVHGYNAQDAIQVIGPLPALKARSARAGR